MGRNQHPQQDTEAPASDEALAWVARLQGDSVSDNDIDAFALWLGADSSHPPAMDAAIALWEELAVVSLLPETGDIAPAERTGATGARPREAANASSWWVPAAAVAACLFTAILLWPVVGGDAEAQVFTTALGERRTVILADDSRLLLNTSSRIRVQFESDQRRLSLLRGEVYFEVASDPERPFHVDTGSARATAIGTAFNIRRRPDSVEILVTEGVVRVEETGGSGSRSPAVEILHANQSLLASRGGFQASGGSDSDRHRQLAWQRGELVADEMRLPVLARELERYHDLNILIADADVAAMTVSGVFSLDQPPEDLLRALELSLDLEARELDQGTVQLLKRAR
jgi:transmembrane sensor